MIAGVVLLVGLLVIAYLWAIGHPAIIDRGPLPGDFYPFWDDHSIGHLLGAMGIAWGVGMLTGWVEVGWLVSMVLWVMVEVAQAHPRDRGRGYFSVEDVIVDAAGATLGALLCAAL